MTIFLTILLIAAMIAVVVALVRGLGAFLLNASAEARGDDASAVSASSVKSNKMMQYRIMFQAAAIFLIVLILFIGGRT